jgi:hypothetical protein
MAIQEQEQEIVYPQRLVMIHIQDNCMFCENPKGECYHNYVYLQEHYGYITCANCIEKGKEAATYWNKHIAYGKANYLKDQSITIKRSSGELDEGWALDNPLLGIARNGTDTIHCFHSEKQLGRWCYLDEIVRLNPPKASEAVPDSTSEAVPDSTSEAVPDSTSEAEADASEADTVDIKNLCVNCGINMGSDNPRQLCGKTSCPNEEGEFL